MVLLTLYRAAVFYPTSVLLRLGRGLCIACSSSDEASLGLLLHRRIIAIDIRRRFRDLWPQICYRAVFLHLDVAPLMRNLFAQKCSQAAISAAFLVVSEVVVR